MSGICAMATHKEQPSHPLQELLEESVVLQRLMLDELRIIRMALTVQTDDPFPVELTED